MPQAQSHPLTGATFTKAPMATPDDLGPPLTATPSSAAPAATASDLAAPVATAADLQIPPEVAERMAKYGEPLAVAQRHVATYRPGEVQQAAVPPEPFTEFLARKALGVNPDLSRAALAQAGQPGVGNKIVGGAEYVASGVPFAGAPLVRAMQESGRGQFGPAALHTAEAGIQAALLPIAGERVAAEIAGREGAEFLPEAGQALRKAGVATLKRSPLAGVLQPGNIPAQAAEQVAPHATEADLRIASNAQSLSQTVDPARIEARSDVGKVLDAASDKLQSNPAARQGPITFEQQQALASSLGMDARQLVESEASKPFSAEELVAARATADASLTQVMNEARLSEDPAHEQAFFESLARHQEILNTVKARLGETGRALGAARNEPSADLRQRALDYLSQMPRDVRADLARRLALIPPENVGALNRFVSEITPSTTGEKLHELWLNGLLTGGAVIKKSVGDATMLFKSPFERLAGGDPSGAWHLVQGWFAGLGNAVDSFSSTFKNEVSATHGEFQTPRGAIKGALGGIVRLPVRTLGAITDFFHALNYSGALNAEAYKRATREGLEGDALTTRAAELAANPTQAVRERAFAFAQKQTFQEPAGQGQGVFGLVGRALKPIQQHPIGKYIVPFLKTPLAILHENVRFSPAGFVEAGAKALKGEYDPQLVGKAVLGTSAFAWATHKASLGLISGAGPQSSKDRLRLEAEGWQPFSVKLGDRWVSYKYWEPIAPVLAAAASFVEWSNAHPYEDSTSRFVAGLQEGAKEANNALPFASTLAAASDAIRSQNRFNALVSKKLGTVIPTGVADIAKATDRTVRKPATDTLTNAVVQGLESRLPGLSKNVPPLTSPEGVPIQRPASSVGGLNPFGASQSQPGLDALQNRLAAEEEIKAARREAKRLRQGAR